MAINKLILANIFDNLILINMFMLDPPTHVKLYSEYTPLVAESFLPVGSAPRDWAMKTKYCPIVPVEVSGYLWQTPLLCLSVLMTFFCMFCRPRRIHLSGMQKSLLKKRFWRKWSEVRDHLQIEFMIITSH